MCGIAGYVGYREAAPLLTGALRKLEYRGYDSAGIAVLETEGVLTVCKAKGPLDALERRLAEGMPHGTLGIGHTRWATHGEPSDINSHPHTDTHGAIAVVHNGIIENYLPLKQWLEARGAVFQSDTDTEVIAQLVSYYYHVEEARTHTSLFDAVLSALYRLEGSYALAVAAAAFPDRLIAVRKDSPLIIGLGTKENFLASDAPALLAHTREVYYLEDHEAAVVYRDHVDLYTGEGERIIKNPVHVDWDTAAAEKAGYAHFMLKEIHEQPRAVTDTLRPRLVYDSAGIPCDINLDALDLFKTPLRRIVLTACGTAAHAAIVAKYAFIRLARIHAEVELASEFRYGEPLLSSDDLVIVVSQSGETADTLAAMRSVKKSGARLLAITNVVGSTLARETDATFYTWAGPEIAVASTKAFTTQLICLYLIALKAGFVQGALNNERYRAALAGLEALPSGIEAVLSQTELVQRFAARQFNKSKVFFMGRQFDYATALESALKLKEINYTHSEAFAAGELKHGPIALVDTDTLVVVIATDPALFDKVVSNIREVRSRGASTLVITRKGAGETAFAPVAEEVLTLPETTEAAFAPLLAVIPAQLFAYYCAVQRGNDPDKPRNLAKSVTVE
ncbi:MAG: glutamine--fructose-6-phosphate transaminase (isomerizing) [Spirochaetaceae bacterium]|jgi:glucosamine--fructose-6-phosphate aminotransferase (isomerizing)|nr:glutamine--fructose-6-phosphate transaminase (isomerizing) [Spirochaetaceae bacterium]